jgi:hypothetical protein
LRAGRPFGNLRPTCFQILGKKRLRFGAQLQRGKLLAGSYREQPTSCGAEIEPVLRRTADCVRPLARERSQHTSSSYQPFELAADPESHSRNEELEPPPLKILKKITET